MATDRAANDIPVPRRNRPDLMTPAELAIANVMRVVELAGADVRLTDAVNLLQAARESVADYIDNVDNVRRDVQVRPVRQERTDEGNKRTLAHGVMDVAADGEHEL